ncbi:MAG: hypothetical protein M3N31_07855 [Actinomycetota bacterium]|nr:hypothetical protein [Actinomycetota bacterium]
MRSKKLLTVAALALGATLGGGGTAWASHEASHYPGEVGGTGRVRNGGGLVDPGSAATPSRTEGRTEGTGTGLPLTGGDVVGLTLIGMGAIGAGSVLVRRSLRPS